MSDKLRLAVLLPLSLLYVLVLFVFPDMDLGIVGGIALILSAWGVWYLTWASLAKAGMPGDGMQSLQGSSPGEQRAWVGAAFTLAILAWTAWAAPGMVGADGGMAPEASELGEPVGLLVIAWLVVMHLLRKRWLDTVEEDERDLAFLARGERWARGAMAILAIGLALVLAFTPVPRLAWAGPMNIANLLVAFVVATCFVEYMVVATAYWRDRH